MRLDKAAVDRYLEIIREIGLSLPLTDCHVHPFEVLFDEGVYRQNPDTDVYSVGDLCYVPPATAELDLASPAPQTVVNVDLAQRMTLLAVRRMYVHTGRRCWADQMALAGFGRAVLLPVAQPGFTAEARMAEMAAMFRGEPRFLRGYSLPNTIRASDVEADVRRAMALHGIRVLKVHPNLSGHDLTSSSGRERVEALFTASRRTGLPVIVHGGPSQSVRNAAAACYAEIENLACLDFGRTDRPVVIAHSGAFGLPPAEVEARVLPLLQALLRRFDHLLVDTSALTTEVLQLVLLAVDPGKIVFGSDALYDAPWKAAVRLFWLLERTFDRPADIFARIAGSTPDHLFGKETTHAAVAAHQIFPVP